MTENNKIKCFLLLVFLTFVGCSLSAKESFERFPLTEKVNTFTFSVDEKFLITADKTHIKVWNNATKKVIASFKAHEKGEHGDGYISDLKLTDDNKYLYSVSSTGSVKKWSFKKRVVLFEAKLDSLKKILFYKNSIIIQNDLEFYKYNLQLKRVKKIIAFDFFNHTRIDDFKINNDCLYVITTFGLTIVSIKSNKVNNRYENLGTLMIKFYNKKKFYTISERTFIQVIDADRLKQVKKFKAHKHYVQDIAISNNKKYFASSGEEGPIKIWDAKTYRVVKELEFKGHRYTYGNLYFSKDDKYLYVLGDDLRRYVLDLK